MPWNIRNAIHCALRVLILVVAGPAQADNTGTRMARAFLAGEPVPLLTVGYTLPEAQAVQADFVRALLPTLGGIVGYKAGLTTTAAQQHLGIGHPVLGVLLRGMLVEDGATLAADYGARPMAEGDLIVRVRSAAINEARDPAAALAALDAVYPFIELPNLAYARSAPLDGPAAVAVNVGARYGVLGAPIALDADPAWQQRLADFTLTLQNGDGKVLGSGRGADLLGHPLQAVLWLRDTLHARGERLHAGQLLSLGALTGLQPVRAGGQLRAVYEGLDPRGPVTVSVDFD